MAILMLLLFIVFPTILISLSILLKRHRYIVFVLAVLLPTLIVVWDSSIESIIVNLDAIALYSSAYIVISAVIMFITAKIRSSV